jgi:hypothetical protein
LACDLDESLSSDFVSSGELVLEMLHLLEASLKTLRTGLLVDREADLVTSRRTENFFLGVVTGSGTLFGVVRSAKILEGELKGDGEVEEVCRLSLAGLDGERDSDLLSSLGAKGFVGEGKWTVPPSSRCGVYVYSIANDR